MRREQAWSGVAANTATSLYDIGQHRGRFRAEPTRKARWSCVVDGNISSLFSSLFSVPRANPGNDGSGCRQ